MRKSVLITGATGFVGRHLSRFALSKKGVQVYGLVRASSRGKLVPGVRPVRADLLSADSMLRVLRKVRPHRVFHLAGQSSAALSWKEPRRTFDVNVGGTRSLLEAARRMKSRARILVTGSADEYGTGARAGSKLDEKMALRPVNPYGVSKLTQELLALRYFSSYGLFIVCARAFNHIGPGQSDPFVVPAFAKQVARIEREGGKPVLKVGNLGAVRDFTDVRDVVRAYWLLLEKGRAGQAYNVASGRARRVADVLRFYLDAASVRIEVRRDRSRLRASDARWLVGDARKLRRATGWRPKISFERTLTDTLQDWRERLK